MKKITCYTEAAYVLSIVLLAIGTAFMEKAQLGLSVVVAPSYLIYAKLSSIYGFFTFGMAEYIFQACILLIVVITLKKIKIHYLFSFFTVLTYGLILDAVMYLFKIMPSDMLILRILYLILGILLCSISIAFIFRTYITPSAYEVFVKEISAKTKINLYKFKIIYDFSSCILAIIFSFMFFGLFTFIGIHVGTIICTFANGFFIFHFEKILCRIFNFTDGLPFRKFFE